MAIKDGQSKYNNSDSPSVSSARNALFEDFFRHEKQLLASNSSDTTSASLLLHGGVESRHKVANHRPGDGTLENKDPQAGFKAEQGKLDTSTTDTAEVNWDKWHDNIRRWIRNKVVDIQNNPPYVYYGGSNMVITRTNLAPEEGASCLYEFYVDKTGNLYADDKLSIPGAKIISQGNPSYDKIAAQALEKLSHRGILKFPKGSIKEVTHHGPVRLLYSNQSSHFHPYHFSDNETVNQQK